MFFIFPILFFSGVYEHHSDCSVLGFDNNSVTDSQLGLVGVNSAGQSNYNGIDRRDNMVKAGNLMAERERNSQSQQATV